MNNTLDQLKNTFLNHARHLWGSSYGIKDVELDVEHDFLTDHETDDGREFLHYMDGTLELIILPDEVLDDRDEEFNDYTKFVY